MKYQLLTISGLIALICLSSVEADPGGTVTVIDGDTLDIDGQRIRLFGIDAPESKQICADRPYRWRCGDHATQALTNLIANRTVTCRGRGQDEYGRIIGVCRAGTLDINAWMVSQGLALAYASDYIGQEQTAKAAGRGLWKGDFVTPWDWRKGKRIKTNVHTRNRATRCLIKGNVSYETGDLIYHAPGTKSYHETNVASARGERWFCSETEAEAAGWRKPRH